MPTNPEPAAGGPVSSARRPSGTPAFWNGNIMRFSGYKRLSGCELFISFDLTCWRLGTRLDRDAEALELWAGPVLLCVSRYREWTFTDELWSLACGKGATDDREAPHGTSAHGASDRDDPDADRREERNYQAAA